ncbi:MAG: glycerol-3-phosphate dehydrogenase [Pseudomonadota bacterium]
MADPKAKKPYDILIIGGGINGCGIARDAAGRGYSVCLAEMNDLASGTSSWSTKLIHGGLRYLEYYEFRLVREALIEREILWAVAPHIVRPLRFILPHHKGLRPAWLIRLGLFLYDYLGGRKALPPTTTIDLSTHETGKPLKPLFSKGFEYSDCWVDDARLVVLNAVDAAERGADIYVRTKVISAKRVGGLWHAVLKDMTTCEERTITARLIVNAAGPWVDAVLTDTVGRTNQNNVRMVQGSHIVVNKMFDHDRCYIFQNDDNRIIFAIPYEQDFTLIGTTDRDYDGDPADVKITQGEIDYLCDAASDYFKTPLAPKDIVWTYSGVRPLYDDGASEAQEATRDYTLKLDKSAEDAAPLVNIFGGKITTYRKLAESMLDIVEAELGAKKPSWTGNGHLPGGNFEIDEVDALVDRLQSSHPFIRRETALRLVRAYGTDTATLLEGITTLDDLGDDFSGASNAGLYASEIDYLMDHEWAQTAEDVLWRRSKLGLRVSKENAKTIENYMQARRTHDKP